MKEDKVVYAMALLAVLSVAGLLLFELALSPKARYPLTVTRVQQVQQVLRGEEVQQGEGVMLPYGEGEASFPMNINQATAEDLMEADRIGEKRAQDILDFIAARGGISDMDELLEIEGIGEATLAGLKELFMPNRKRRPNKMSGRLFSACYNWMEFRSR